MGNAAVAALVGRPATGPVQPRAVVQRAISAGQAGDVAHRLLEAMEGWGTDEDAIFGALSGRTRLDLSAITEAYEPISMNGSLDADLRDELTDGEYARAQTLLATAEADQPDLTPEEALAQRAGRAEDVAAQLDEAMSGWGTDEQQLLNALAGRTPFQVVAIARAYKDRTGRDLLGDLRDELSGDQLDQALGLATAMYRQGDGPEAEIGRLQQALNATHATTTQLRITGMFDAPTTAALTAFQAAHAPLDATGVLTLETWLALDAAAPMIARGGRVTITGGAEGDGRGVPVGGAIHPTLRRGSTGPAVEELQQKLATIPAEQVPTRVGADGDFGRNTRSAVREFQGSRTPPLPVNGVADKDTWAALDAVAGPVTVGREEFTSFERVEGTEYGGPTKFTWRLHPDRMEVTVNIRWTGAPAHPMVATWMQQMASAWNVFKMVDDDHPGTELPLQFVVGSGSPADATIQVTVTPPGGTPGRSNAGNYHTGDTRTSLAPHEFGHLIGLQDEYNTGPEQYTIITGDQPPIGTLDAPVVGGSPVPPETIAAEIRTAVTSSPAGQRGAKAQQVVATKYSLAQGAFAQRVGVAYEQANAGNMMRETNGVVAVDAAAHIEDDIAARIPGTSAQETDATTPFGYDNRSLMGSMDSFDTQIGEHDHPINERHVRHFAQLLGRNRPGNWRIAPR